MLCLVGRQQFTSFLILYFLSVLLSLSQVHTFSGRCLQTVSVRSDTTQIACAMAQTSAGFEPRTFWLNPRPVRAGFMVEKWALLRGFLRVLRLPTVRFTPPKLYTYLFVADTT